MVRNGNLSFECCCIIFIVHSTTANCRIDQYDHLCNPPKDFLFFHLETCAIVFPDVPACASEFSKYLDSITVSASRIAETGHISILAMNLPPPEKIRLSSHLSYR